MANDFQSSVHDLINSKYEKNRKEAFAWLARQAQQGNTFENRVAALATYAGRNRCVIQLRIWITPTEAQWLLARNKANRPLLPQHKHNLKVAVDELGWSCHGTISLGWDMILNDGQHRLELIASGTEACEVNLILGEDPAVRLIVDGGRTKNTTNHMLAHPLVCNNQELTNLVKDPAFVPMYRRFLAGGMQSTELFKNAAQLVQWLPKYLPALRAVHEVLRKEGYPAPVRAAVARAYYKKGAAFMEPYLRMFKNKVADPVNEGNIGRLLAYVIDRPEERGMKGMPVARRLWVRTEEALQAADQHATIGVWADLKNPPKERWPLPEEKMGSNRGGALTAMLPAKAKKRGKKA